MNKKLILGLIFGVSSICIILNILNGRVSGLYTFLFIVGAIAIFVFYLWYIVKYKITSLFKQPEISEILHYYDNMDSNLLPESDAIRSYSKSLALSLYGNFEDGLSEIEKVAIEGKPPIYHAKKLNAIVVNNYLQRKNIEESVEMSKYAKELANQGAEGLGKKTGQKAYETYVLIGKVLSGNFEDNIVSILEDRFSNSQFLIKIQIAWIFGIIYLKKGESEKQDSMQKYIIENAPYSTPLQNFKL